MSMPYTEKQQRLFHEAEENPDVAERHGMSHADARKLADESDKLKREGREKKTSFIDLTPVFAGVSSTLFR